MIHLCLDTCTWIYLANGFEPGKLISYIDTEIQKGNIKIILPDLVIEEWKRNSVNAVSNEVERNFKDSLNGITKIKQLIENQQSYDVFSLVPEISKEDEAFNTLLDLLNSKKEFIKKKAEENVQAIERIFGHSSTIKTTYSQDNVNVATRFALQKLAPFGKKNSMSDALIFLQMIEYLQVNQIKGAYFITWNLSDFSPNKKGLETNLNDLLLKVNGKFFSTLSYAMNSIGHEVVTADELKAIERKKIEVEEWENNEYGCNVCKNYSSRWSPIFFHDDYPIIDERNSYDPSQLNLFTLDKEPIRHYKSVLQTAACDFCGAVHIKCPDCSEIMDFPDSYTYNEIHNCIECDLKFVFRLKNDRKGEIETCDFLIIDTIQKCPSCGDDFVPYYEDSELCQICEYKVTLNS